LGSKGEKITVVGAGTIGSLIAYTLMAKKLASEITLVNRNEDKASVKTFDMSHTLPLIGGTSIEGGSYEKSKGSQVIIITSGVLPKLNGSRMDVLQHNLDIYRNLIPKLADLSPEAVIVTVTNPVDIMALAAAKYSGFSNRKIIGSGTLLDSMRFRSFISKAIKVPPEDVDAIIVGEHGDTMVPIWSQTKIKGVNVQKYVKDRGIYWNSEVENDIFQKTKGAGWKIREGNQHSSYAIAYSATTIAEAIIQESQEYFPVSFEQSDTYGLKDLFMSLPIQLGKEGYKRVYELDFTKQELKLIDESARKLKSNIEKIKF
jgi:L-lactate dehydrogenase